MQTSPGPEGEVRRTSRTAGGDSRERLVGAAVDLILEHHRGATDPKDLFAFLTPGAVASRAGVSRGLIYHYWSAVDGNSADSFSRFLASVSERLWQDLAVPEDLEDFSGLLPDNLSDVIGTLSTYELLRLTGPDKLLSRAVLALTLYGISRPDHVEESIDRLAVLYERILKKLGLEPVPPLQHRDIALAIMCLVDGFTVNAPVIGELAHRSFDWVPSVEPVGHGVDWTLFGITVESIALNMTRPIGSDGH